MFYILFLLFTLTYANIGYVPCRDALAQHQEPHLIGLFIPTCREDDDLLYKTLQCHGSIGMCACVDQVTGERLTDLWRLTEEEFTKGEKICDEKIDLNKPSI